MASYIANNQNRDTVTIMLSKAEAEALLTVLEHGFSTDDYYKMNGQSRSAVSRAHDALLASVNTSARRAGYFDV
jgi:hypothetical protein